MLLALGYVLQDKQILPPLPLTIEVIGASWDNNNSTVDLLFVAFLFVSMAVRKRVFHLNLGLICQYRTILLFSRKIYIFYVPYLQSFQSSVRGIYHVYLYSIKSFKNLIER